MPKIAPLRGYYYNPERISDLSLVATPPYDVISTEDASRYRKRNPYNIIRLILPLGEGGMDKYREASQYFRDWEEKGVFLRDSRPSFYPYQQVFYSPSNEKKKRNGFISLVKLEEWGGGGIIPHEKTTPKPVEDRLSLIEACGANFSQVFTLYSDPEGEIEDQFVKVWSSQPRYEFQDDDGVIHRLWQMDDKKVITEVVNIMRDKSLLIADGHHRYKTALIYRDKMREKYPSYSETSPFEYTMLYLTPMEGEGLLILPTHRLVSPKEPFDLDAFYNTLKKYFSLRSFNFKDAVEEKKAREQFLSDLNKRDMSRYTFGLYITGEKRYIHLISKAEIKANELLSDYPTVLQELDVTMLDGFILKKILGFRQEDVGLLKDSNEALEEVHKGRYRVAFLLNPSTIQQINRVVAAGEVMPRKTTFFSPKVASGLVINKIVPDEEVTTV